MRGLLKICCIACLHGLLQSCGGNSKHEGSVTAQDLQIRQRFDSVLEVARYYESVSDPRFPKYYDSLIVLERLLPDSLGYVQRVLVGTNYDALSGRVDEAIASLDNVQKVAKRNAFDHELALIYQRYGTAYVIRGDYDVALKYLFEALRLHELHGDSSAIADSYTHIGLAYFKLRNNEQAIEYYRKRLALKQGRESYLVNARTLINIGLAFSELSQYDSAQYFYDHAAELLGTDLPARADMILCFARGKTFTDMGFPAKAAPYLKHSMDIAEQNGDYRFMAENGVALARVSIAQNDLKKGRALLYDAANVAADHNLKEILLDVYRQYIEVARKEGGVVELTDWQRKYIELSQALYNEQLISKISALQVQFEERENIAAIESQEQLLNLQAEAIAKRRLVILLLVAAALLMVVILYVLRKVSIQRKRMNEALDKEVIRQTQELAARNSAAELEAKSLQLRFQDSCQRARQMLATLKGLYTLETLDGDAGEHSESAKVMLERILKCEEVLNRLSSEAAEIDLTTSESDEKDQGLS